MRHACETPSVLVAARGYSTHPLGALPLLRSAARSRKAIAEPWRLSAQHTARCCRAAHRPVQAALVSTYPQEAPPQAGGRLSAQPHVPSVAGPGHAGANGSQVRAFGAGFMSKALRTDSTVHAPASLRRMLYKTPMMVRMNVSTRAVVRSRKLSMSSSCFVRNGAK